MVLNSRQLYHTHVQQNPNKDRDFIPVCGEGCGDIFLSYIKVGLVDSVIYQLHGEEEFKVPLEVQDECRVGVDEFWQLW